MAAAAALVILMATAEAQVAPGDRRAATLAEGKQLFERQWQPGKSDDAHGDGLGPMFNHTSCVACHRQGGVGGGGPVDVNALMLSVMPPQLDSAATKRDFLKAVKAVHPGFVTAQGDLVLNVILHRFSTDGRYNALRAKLAGADLPLHPTAEQVADAQERAATSPVQWVTEARPLNVAITQRNAPAMFGAGLIDAIPDATLRAIATAQRGHKEVSGRVAPVSLSKVGRFGWRGQTEHLADFVQGACANELGLEVPANAQPDNPLAPDYRPPGVDLLQTECNKLIAFVGSLPAPRFVPPEDPDKLAAVDRGYKLFHQIGCSVCHVENVAPAQGVFSDFLLHDMGGLLGDPVVAQPMQFLVSVEQQMGNELTQRQASQKPAHVELRPPPSTYYGGLGTTPGSSLSPIAGISFANQDGGVTTFRIVAGMGVVKSRFAPAPTNVAQEWKTPPLWGVADSAPYMHDGRAKTPLDAIVLHGGEAKACTERFLALPAGDRMAILEFLGCLKAPDPEAAAIASR